MLSKRFNLTLGRRRATDPVCGMLVDTARPPHGTQIFDGTTYYFCSKGCRLEFEEDPRGYLSGGKRLSM